MPGIRPGGFLLAMNTFPESDIMAAVTRIMPTFLSSPFGKFHWYDIGQDDRNGAKIQKVNPIVAKD
jgi:hypothetical protein